MTPLAKVYCPDSYFAMRWYTAPKHVWSYFSEIMEIYLTSYCEVCRVLGLLWFETIMDHIFHCLTLFWLNLPECLPWLNSPEGSALWFPLTSTSGVSSKMMPGQRGTKGQISQGWLGSYRGWEKSLENGVHHHKENNYFSLRVKYISWSKGQWGILGILGAQGQQREKKKEETNKYLRDLQAILTLCRQQVQMTIKWALSFARKVLSAWQQLCPWWGRSGWSWRSLCGWVALCWQHRRKENRNTVVQGLSDTIKLANMQVVRTACFGKVQMQIGLLEPST